MLKVSDVFKFISMSGLVEELSKVRHGVENNFSPYHLEDNIMIHTQMVADKIMELFKRDIDKNPKLLLMAYLHDIGKPVTEQIIETKKRKRKIFNGHDYASALLAIGYLRKFEEYTGARFTDEEKREIILPILFHQLAHKYPVNTLTFPFLSKTEIWNLYMLEKADDLGRITENRNLNKNVDFQKIEEYWKWKNETDKYEKEIHLFYGIPGTGKTTFRKQMIEKHGEENIGVISYDDIVEEYAARVGKTYKEVYDEIDKNWAQKKMNEKIRNAKEKDIVIVDMTNLTKKTRRNWLNRFKNRKRIIHIFLRDLNEIPKIREDKMPIEIIYNMLKSNTIPDIIDEKINELQFHFIF